MSDLTSEKLKALMDKFLEMEMANNKSTSEQGVEEDDPYVLKDGGDSYDILNDPEESNDVSSEYENDNYDIPVSSAETGTSAHSNHTSAGGEQGSDIHNDATTQNDWGSSWDSFFGNNEEIEKNVHTTQRPFESVLSEPFTSEFMGKPFTYQRFSAEMDFGEGFTEGMDDENYAYNFVRMQREITEQVCNHCGGWSRVRELAVISNILIINGVSFEPYVPKSYVDHMPYDLRNNVIAGQFAWLFDFSVLRKMKNLTALKFDTCDFVYSKVRKDLRVVFDFEPSYFFSICKGLQELQIGEYCFNFNTRNDHNDIFHRAKRSEEIYNKCVDFGWGATKKGWSSIVDVFKDPDRGFLSKAWGITWRGVGTAVAGTATTGMKLGGLVTKMGKSLVNFANTLKDNL